MSTFSISGEYAEEGKSPSLGSNAVTELPLSEVSERRLLRKLDFHLLPLISFIHLLSFLSVSLF
jgi:hypothetical protein